MVVHSYQKKDIYQHKSSFLHSKCILLWLKKCKNFVTKKHLLKKFGVIKTESKKELYQILKNMEKKKQIIYIKNRYYLALENLNIIKGKVIGHKDGYGFLRTDLFKEDLWLSEEEMKFCIHGDSILAHMIENKKKKRNSVIFLKRLNSANILIPGRYYVKNNVPFVIPDDPRFNFKIFIIKSCLKKIEKESIVIVKLIKNFTKKKYIKGSIIEILGKKMNTHLSIQMALRAHSIPFLWSQEVKDQLCRINNKIHHDDFQNRIDLRHLHFFTIDDEDARDFDDAIFCQKSRHLKNHWNLWVAVSDVSYYIPPNTAIDKAALDRGTSIYFPSLVIPMLPEKISVDLCSLKPYVERLCLICEMHLSEKGDLISFKHYEAVIRSHGRFTYNEIYKIWNGDASLRSKHHQFLQDIDNLFHLKNILNKENCIKKRISFNLHDPKFILDHNLKIQNICPNLRNDAHKLIESCMILANIASALFVKKYKHPSLFRNHESPEKDKIVNFRIFLKDFGLRLSGGDTPKPIHYANLLKSISQCSLHEVIQLTLLRSMKQAIYSEEENIGHFGLSLSNYVHFTSPIRRYSDLILHRIIKHLLVQNKKKCFKKNKISKINHLYSIHEIKKIGQHCSMTERRADEASKNVSDWLKCDFMRKKIGKIFKGVISNVTSFGFFVRINSFLIEGLVHITSLNDDFYYFDSVRLKLIGKHKKNIFCLGDVLKVKILSVSIHDKKIKLSLHYPH